MNEYNRALSAREDQETTERLALAFTRAVEADPTDEEEDEEG